MSVLTLKERFDFTTADMGIEDRGDGQAKLTEIPVDLINDPFDDGALDLTKFTPVIAGTGTVIETTVLKCYQFNQTTDAALVYVNTPVVRTDEFDISYDFKLNNGVNQLIFNTQQENGAPTVGAFTASVAKLRASVLYDGTDITIRYNALSNIVVSTPGTAGLSYKLLFESNGTSWRITIYSAIGAVLITSGWIAWALVTDNGQDEWFVLGGMITNFYAGQTDFSNFIYSVIGWPVSPTVEEITIDYNDAIAYSTVLLHSSTFADIGDCTLEASLDSGSTWGAPLTFNIVPVAGRSGVYQLTDSGTWNPTGSGIIFRLTIYGANGYQEVWPIELEGITILSGSQAAIEDVRFGTVYNDGALTGTAHMVTAPDTREGVLTDDTVGTLAVAGPTNVRRNIPTDDTVGVYDPADPTLYANNEQYGANGTEFTGSKVVTQFQNPVEVVLEDSEIILFEGD